MSELLPPYRHLSQIEFESAEEEAEIRRRGMEGPVSKRAMKLGEKYHSLILNAYIPRVSVRPVPPIGYGLFAEEEIPKGAYVGEYTGTVRRNDRRYFEPLNNYCYEYPVPDEIGRNYVIDATAGCLTRFINHNFEPNLEPIHVYWDGFYHLIFLSKKKISIGDQFSFDYGENYWYLREKPIVF